jgi:hypothetical protein
MCFPKLTPALIMARQRSVSHIVPLTLPALVLLSYGCFIFTTYWPYLDWHAHLRSPQLAGLPEDIIGYGFWMWWPFLAILSVISLAAALSAIKRWLYAAAPFLGLFAAMSIADYVLCKRLVQELIRPHV